MAIDEMMITFFGRTILKQFMRNKPIRFGIKLWAICTIFRYVLDFNIYFGKDDTDGEETLGSRAVLKMLKEFFSQVAEDDVKNYQLFLIISLHLLIY